MPKNKTQGIILGIIMSYAMAFGMEIYNTAINHGYHLAEDSFSSMTNVVFLDALKEMTFMGLFVILFPISGATALEPLSLQSTVIRKKTILTYAVFCVRQEPLLLCVRP